MKKIILSSLITLTIMAGCKSKKGINASSSTNPSDAQLTAAKTKFPDVTIETLNKGHSIYYGACTRCHGAKDIANYTENEFQQILNKMAPKAELSAQEKDAVWKYAMAIKLSANIK